MRQTEWRALLLVYLIACPGPPSVVGYNSLHLVDLQAVVCSADGYYDVELNTNELSGSTSQYAPHVVSFLRSTNQATTVSFSLINGNGKEWVEGIKTVQLDYLGTRRLSAQDAEITLQYDAVEVEMLAGSDLLADQRGDLDEDAGSLAPRRLASRRRSPPRRRSPSPRYLTTTTQPRPPAPSPTPTTHRRRAPGTSYPTSSPRRRGAPVPTGPRRRTTAYNPPGAPATHNRWSSTSSGNTGYGYTSGTAMQGNYGGGYPQAAPYGYSGPSSYGPSRTSSAKMLMGGFAAGAVAGVGSYYLYQRLSSSSCIGYGCCWGCSDSCYGRNDCGSACDQCTMGMDRPYYRDDIMADGGFYPADQAPFPLKIRVLSVTGANYSAADICPPSECSAADCGSAPARPMDDLFITLTRLEELSDDAVDVSEARPRSAGCALAVAGAAGALCLMLPGSAAGA